MVRRSTCSASSALTQYSGSSSAHQVLLEPYSNTGSGLASPHSPRPSTASHPGGSITRNYSVSPHIDRSDLATSPDWRVTTSCCRNESLRDNINAAKTLVIILIVFFVCWFPFFTTYFLSFVLKVRERDRSGVHKDQLLKYPTCALHKAFMVCTNNQIKLRIKRKISI